MAKPNFTPAKRMQVNNFEKEFENFTDMVNELKTIHPEIKNIFTYDEDEVLPQNATADVVNYFLNNYPDVVNRSNLPVAVSASSNKVSLKTNKFFAIKWKFKYDANGFVTDLVAGFSVFSRDKLTKTLSDTLDYLKDENNGWKVVEDTYEKKPNRKNNNRKKFEHEANENTEAAEVETEPCVANESEE